MEFREPQVVSLLRKMRKHRIQVDQVEASLGQARRRQGGNEGKVTPRVGLPREIDGEFHHIDAMELVSRDIAHEEADRTPPATTKIEDRRLARDGPAAAGGDAMDELVGTKRLIERSVTVAADEASLRLCVGQRGQYLSQNGVFSVRGGVDGKPYVVVEMSKDPMVCEPPGSDSQARLDQRECSLHLGLDGAGVRRGYDRAQKDVSHVSDRSEDSPSVHPYRIYLSWCRLNADAPVAQLDRASAF